MAIMIVDANPIKVGKFAFRLRAARDALTSISITQVVGNVVTTNSDIATGTPIFFLPKSAGALPGGIQTYRWYFYIRLGPSTGNLANTKKDSSVPTPVVINNPGNTPHEAFYSAEPRPTPASVNDYYYFVTKGGDPNFSDIRKQYLARAGINSKIVSDSDPADDEVTGIDGNELSVLFDDDTNAQTAVGGRTIMVIPSANDLAFLWEVPAPIYDKDNSSKVTKDDFAELGRYLLKRCR